jgi:hypothetical protein
VLSSAAPVVVMFIVVPATAVVAVVVCISLEFVTVEVLVDVMPTLEVDLLLWQSMLGSCTRNTETNCNANANLELPRCVHLHSTLLQLLRI